MSYAIAAENWKHNHVFDSGNPLAEKNTLRVVVLTAAMMVAEIVCGWMFNSMALLADGWHMSSHAVALGLSVLAYAYARKFAQDPRFAFGTWKIEILGGYTSSLFLVGVAVFMFYESLTRLFHPSPILFDQAIPVAVLGLIVNLVCAWLLKDGHHEHDEHHDHHHHDLNLRSAYMHVVADAATSVLAISALIGGKIWGANWLDPVMGISGGVLVLVWANGLLRDTGRVLLDAEMNAPVVAEIRDVIRESPVAAEICDLHVWRVAKGKYACVLSLVTPHEVSPDYFRERLGIHDELVHVTVEINRSNHCAMIRTSPTIDPEPNPAAAC
ncbi:MAG: CDF family Co(II)/Ni(II) efflux transporter DmeF [Burkholderiales bacterium]|nr:CDF family Co(II)/Ni(II) efflux transporter DmeF [Burkholderiales bacterium]